MPYDAGQFDLPPADWVEPDPGHLGSGNLSSDRSAGLLGSRGGSGPSSIKAGSQRSVPMMERCERLHGSVAEPR